MGMIDEDDGEGNNHVLKRRKRVGFEVEEIGQ
jgi:hypothetical protein